MGKINRWPTLAFLDLRYWFNSAIGVDNKNYSTTGTLGAGATTVTSLDAGSGAIDTTGIITGGNLVLTSTAGPAANISRTISVRDASSLTANTAINIADTFDYSGTAITGFNTLLISMTDDRTITTGGDIYQLMRTGIVQTRTTAGYNNTSSSFQGAITDNSTYTAGFNAQSNNYASYLTIDNSYTVNKTGGTHTANSIGSLITISGTPTITAGGLTQNIYGIKMTGAGNTVGTSNLYVYYNPFYQSPSSVVQYSGNPLGPTHP